MDFKEVFMLGGKTALVTGAARGLGRQIALGLAQYGASLVLADAVYPHETAELVKQCGLRCLAVQTDISDESQVKDLTKMAAAENLQVDILVNNAGVSQLSYIATEDLPVDQWDHIVEINLRGTFLAANISANR